MDGLKEEGRVNVRESRDRVGVGVDSDVVFFGVGEGDEGAEGRCYEDKSEEAQMHVLRLERCRVIVE